MHAPIERQAVGIQRQPQRLRFHPPEIVQGERTQAEQDRQVAVWLRTQVMPVLDRSIEAITGESVRKPPIGLRGKYYGEHSPPRLPKRFPVNTWGFPFYLWRSANGVRVRSVLPEPKNAPKRVGNVIVVPRRRRSSVKC